MENILTKFTADNLEIKLTNEKLFINTAISNETFALRSINGIGVVDLVEQYNKELTLWKGNKGVAIFFYIIGAIIAIAGLLVLSKSPGVGFFCIAFSGLIFWRANNQQKIEPKMMSAVRIMMSGGNRDFKFDKTGVKSENVAEFVAEVESTLTAYHKNKD
jgi:hypothetical protein